MHRAAAVAAAEIEHVAAVKALEAQPALEVREEAGTVRPLPFTRDQVVAVAAQLGGLRRDVRTEARPLRRRDQRPHDAPARQGQGSGLALTATPPREARAHAPA